MMTWITIGSHTWSRADLVPSFRHHRGDLRQVVTPSHLQ
jgi:hypothetical protein